MTNRNVTRPCLVVAGPTAVGKSSVLYDTFPPEQVLIISADSMQVYRDLNIVSATPADSILESYPHVAVNEIDPSDDFSVHEFLSVADRALEEATESDRLPVVVGGTGLYLNAFLFGLDEMPPGNPEFRRELREQAERTSRQTIHDRLAKTDPEAAEKIHPNDLKRTIRALEIYHETGQTKSDLIRESSSETVRDSIDPMVIGLERPRDELRQRIRDRIERMIDQGLIEEINALRKEWDVSQTIRQAIGYPEVVDYLENHGDRDTLVDAMASNTWQLVRNQRNWFGKFPVDTWYHPRDQREQLKQHLCSIKETIHGR